MNHAAHQMMIQRVAGRYNQRQAGVQDWLQWFVQPAEIIWKHHKEFVQGPAV